MDVRKIVAKNLRAYRKNAGLSQEKLGALCGLHRTYIGGIEQNRRNASLKNIGKIADALGIQPMRLFIEYDGNGRPVFDSEGSGNVPEGAISNCALATWENGVLKLTPITAEETDFSIQILGNLVQLGYSDAELVAKYNDVWPQIKSLYGIG